MRLWFPGPTKGLVTEAGGFSRGNQTAPLRQKTFLPCHEMRVWSPGKERDLRRGWVSARPTHIALMEDLFYLKEKLAEEEGFEPSSPGLPVKRFSRPPHSTTLPPLRLG